MILAISAVPVCPHFRMKVNFSDPPAYSATRLPRFPGWLAALGPGIIWMAFSYWILGKGVGCPRHPSGNGGVPVASEGSLRVEGRQWRRFIFIDTGIGIIGNLLTTFMTCFLAYAVLFPQGIVPTEWHLAAEQARFFELGWGTIGRGLFLAISAAFLCDTWLTTADAVARVHIEMIRFYFFRDQPVNERRWYRSMILMLTAVTGATMFLDQPGPLIVLSALIGFVGTVTFSVALILLIHGPFRRALPVALKPGKVSLAFLTISAIAYTLLAVIYLKAKWWG